MRQVAVDLNFMDLASIFKVPSGPAGASSGSASAGGAGASKRKQPAGAGTDSADDHFDENGNHVAGNGGSSKRAKKGGDVTIRESSDEEFRASWGVGGSRPSAASSSSALAALSSSGSRSPDALTAEQRRIQDIVDAGEELPDAIDISRLKRMVLRFEKAITKNRSLRVKYPDEPLKYIESEADLAEEIKAMTTLSSVPELYPALVELGSCQSMLALLSHENTDVAIAAVGLVDELTDDDVVAQTSQEGQHGMRVLVDALVDADALPLLVQNLNRLNEERSDDKEGIFNTLSVIENFVSINPSLAERAVNESSIIPWILARIGIKAFDSVRQYASELLAILLQTSRPNRLRLIDLGGVDTLLRVLAAYRRKDPKDADEVEFMENVFDVLCLCVGEDEGKPKILESEGLELMLLMIKEKKMSRMRAVKVIDHALMGSPAAVTPAAARFVDILGLKTLFSAFMKKAAAVKKYKKEYPDYSTREDDEHLVAIMFSLFKSLGQMPEYRDRLLFKFIENDGEKSRRLLDVFAEYLDRVRKADEAIEMRKRQVRQARQARQARMRAQRRRFAGGEGGDDDDEDEDEDEETDEAGEYIERLDAGLYTLQVTAIVVAYACYGSAEVRAGVQTRMDEMGVPAEIVQAILREYADNLGDGPSQDADKEQTVKDEQTRMYLLAETFLASPEAEQTNGADGPDKGSGEEEQQQQQQRVDQAISERMNRKRAVLRASRSSFQ
ncbi:Catenin-beta-like protein [Entophlyctis helioformis]|nr:Catenin-beta-like protein [Entophlyctis helioformis]